MANRREPKKRPRRKGLDRKAIPDPFAEEDRSPDRGDETRETCPGCLFRRPQREFFEGPPQKGGEWLCLRCRTDGPPAPDPVDMSAVIPQHRRLLRDLFLGKKITDAAKAAGMNLHTANELLRNLHDKPQIAEFQRLFRGLLLQEQLDAFAITRQLRFALQATDARWNPSAERWDHFTDNKTRLRAAEILARLLSLMPREDRAQAVANVQIITNLDTGGPEEPQTDVFEIEATPIQ